MLIFFYNKLINRKTRLDDIWELVNRQLKKRAELIQEYELCFEPELIQKHKLCSETLIKAVLMERTKQLKGIDERIEVYRRIYNEAVHAYNGFINSFPHNMAAAIIGIKSLTYLDDEMVEKLRHFELR